MVKYGLNELRSMFQSFYESKGHFARKSFSLIPEKDKSLLIINSGMAPLKPFFAGVETPPSKRMTTCQKCIRTGDIDNVGYTARHATFFEMLGSFSFGDYFKKESLVWGWEFVTEVLGMPEDKLWASVYLDDDEAVDIWINDVGIPEDRIVKLGKEDNFWEIGVGPCGPCSEVYYDRGPEYGCGSPDCKPGCDCDRFVEFWNHVFTQFNRDENGNYTPLENKNIDTGLGLERLACLMQDTGSIFNIDTINYILEGVCLAANCTYEDGEGKDDVSIRIITDHIRSVVFMTGDGIIPGNEGRGYVLRRLLRRAARHGRLIGINGPLLSALADRVIDISKSAYAELDEKREYIKKSVAVEEEKFSATIESGCEILYGYISSMEEKNERVLSGDKIFKLYDTFGFPLELTQEILAENGKTADVDGFEKSMEIQKQSARSARKGSDSEGWAEETSIGNAPDTLFTGYDTLEDEGIINLLLIDNQEVQTIKAGERVLLILDKTPFYAESGGQAGDKGIIFKEDAMAEVEDVTKSGSIFLHHLTVTKGEFSVGDKITSKVDGLRRNRIARNHTATHILHEALRRTLGTHVEQAGSYVSSGSLRFDFTHFEAMSDDLLRQTEACANEAILSFEPVSTAVMPMQEAVKQGAIALFGEKYGDFVRVVKVGSFSTELCGGTHLSNAGQAGALKIISENGVAAGIRRIEAVTGDQLLQRLNEAEFTIGKISETLKTKPDNLLLKASSITEEHKALRRELEAIKLGAMDSAVGTLLRESQVLNGVTLVSKFMSGSTAEEMRVVCDKVKQSAKKVITVLASDNGGKVTFIVSVSDDLLDKGYHAGEMIKKIAAAAGGSGGGKADMAQAGAKDPARIPEALALAEELL
jgi:alanyl-tRNA synthetase